jgi:hypothetical protein
LGVNTLGPVILQSLEVCLKFFFHNTSKYLLKILLNCQNVIKSISFELKVHVWNQEATRISLSKKAINMLFTFDQTCLAFFGLGSCKQSHVMTALLFPECTHNDIYDKKWGSS